MRSLKVWKGLIFVWNFIINFFFNFRVSFFNFCQKKISKNCKHKGENLFWGFRGGWNLPLPLFGYIGFFSHLPQARWSKLLFKKNCTPIRTFKTTYLAKLILFLLPYYSAANMTGSESVYTVYEGHEVMFHVSTLLPQSGDKQQVERKRHIGNDIVNIVFVDDPAQVLTFDPSLIKSQFTRILLLFTDYLNTCRGLFIDLTAVKF